MSCTIADLFSGTPGQKGRPDSHYAALARVYVAAVKAGHPAPHKAIAERFGGSAGVWSQRISEARRRGLLTAAGPSRSTMRSQLTAYARTVLGGTV